MTNTLELNKGEFYTIESHFFEFEDGCFYEEDRNETIDTYWYEGLGISLQESLEQQVSKLEEDEICRVSLIPRRWATIVDGDVEDYGDDCLGREDFIWNGNELVTEEEYASNIM